MKVFKSLNALTFKLLIGGGAGLGEGEGEGEGEGDGWVVEDGEGDGWIEEDGEGDGWIEEDGEGGGGEGEGDGDGEEDGEGEGGGVALNVSTFVVPLLLLYAVTVILYSLLLSKNIPTLVVSEPLAKAARETLLLVGESRFISTITELGVTLIFSNLKSTYLPDASRLFHDKLYNNLSIFTASSLATPTLTKIGGLIVKFASGVKSLILLSILLISGKSKTS